MHAGCIGACRNLNIKHPKPGFVLNFERPWGTEIKCIRGHRYLYERKDYYDPVKKRNHKVSGRMPGTITPDGFVPRQVKLTAAEIRDIQSVEYGASAYLLQNDQKMTELLQKFFPFRWKKLFAMAAMRCLGESTLKRTGQAY